MSKKDDGNCVLSVWGHQEKRELYVEACETHDGRMVWYRFAADLAQATPVWQTDAERIKAAYEKTTNYTSQMRIVRLDEEKS